MEKMAQLYEGKAKKVYATEDSAVVIVSYKDDATALDGLKKGTIAGKGVVNNRMTNFLMQLLEKNGVSTQLLYIWLEAWQPATSFPSYCLSW